MKIFGIKIDKVMSLQSFQLIRFAALLAISILLSKSGLSTDSIGAYEKFIFLAGLVSFFWMTGNIQSVLSLYHTVKEDQKKSVLFNASLMMLAYSTLAGLVLWIASGPVLDQFGSSSSSNLLLYLILYVILQGPSSLIEYHYLLANKGRWIFWYGLISFGFLLGIVTLAIFTTLDLEWIVLSLIAGQAFRLIWLVFILFKNGSFRLMPDFLKTQFLNSAPLMGVAIIGGSTQYIDGLIVTNLFSNEVFAIFRYGARELPLVVMFANAFSNALVPAFSEHSDIHQPLAEIRKKSTQLMHLLYPMVIVLILLSNWFFPLVFNPDFQESAAVFNIYLMLIAAKLIFPQTILYGLRKNMSALYIGLIALLVHAGFAWFGGLYWGITGVAFAAIVSNLTEKIIMTFYIKRSLGIKISQYQNLLVWFVYNLIMIMAYLYISSTFGG